MISSFPDAYMLSRIKLENKTHLSALNNRMIRECRNGNFKEWPHQSWRAVRLVNSISNFERDEKRKKAGKQKIIAINAKCIALLL